MFRELNGMVKQRIQYLKHVFKSFELLKLENRPLILLERLKTGIEIVWRDESTSEIF